MKKIAIVSILAFLFGVLIAVPIALRTVNIPSKKVGDTDSIRFNSVNISTSKLVTTTSSQILATSSSRVYAAIVNDGANPIYLNLNGDKPATLYEGIRLNANGGVYEIIAGENGYFGGVQAITSTGTASTTVIER